MDYREGQAVLISQEGFKHISMLEAIGYIAREFEISMDEAELSWLTYYWMDNTGEIEKSNLMESGYLEVDGKYILIPANLYSDSMLEVFPEILMESLLVIPESTE